MNRLHLYAALASSLVLSVLPGCVSSPRTTTAQPNATTIPKEPSSHPYINAKSAPCDPIPEMDALIAGCGIDDVLGPHNPRMIQIWGGHLTQQEWFLREPSFAFAISELRLGLAYFRILHGRLPVSWHEFESSCLLPLRPLDPITGRPYNYLAAEQPRESILDFSVSTGTADWVITGRYQTSDGNLEQFTDSDLSHMRYQWWEEDMRAQYSSIVALRGNLLASVLNSVLNDYQFRRNSMPESGKQLLDGLWQVAQGWARNDPTVNCLEPSSFVFGLDRRSELALARWTDDQGNIHIKSFDYSPWPEGGWDHVPTYSELCQRQVQNGYSIDCDEHPDSFPVGYEPPLVLWKCSLHPR